MNLKRWFMDAVRCTQGSSVPHNWATVEGSVDASDVIPGAREIVSHDGDGIELPGLKQYVSTSKGSSTFYCVAIAAINFLV
jgi:hypothetical protein